MPGARQTAGRLKRRVQSAVSPVSATVDTLSAAALVDLAFQITWDRAPTPAERDRLVTDLESGRIDRAAFLAELRSDYAQLPPETAVRLGYTMLLRREPDPVGRETVLGHFATGGLDHWTFVDWLRGQRRVRQPRATASSAPRLHSSRCRFIRTLPLLGTHPRPGWHGPRPRGRCDGVDGLALPFDELVIIDLPPEDRHEIYLSEALEHVDTPRGRSATSTTRWPTCPATRPTASTSCTAGRPSSTSPRRTATPSSSRSRRVLRPGGCLALDTPNGTRVPACSRPTSSTPTTRSSTPPSSWRRSCEPRASRSRDAGGWSTAASRCWRVRSPRPRRPATHGMFADAEHCYLLAYTAVSP